MELSSSVSSSSSYKSVAQMTKSAKALSTGKTSESKPSNVDVAKESGKLSQAATEAKVSVAIAAAHQLNAKSVARLLN